MLFNKNIILEILLSNFSNFESQIESLAGEYVMDLEDNQLHMMFVLPINFALVGGIEEIQVIDYQVLVDKEKSIVNGVMEVVVQLGGFDHWDGTNQCIEFAEGVMGIRFSFRVRNEEYDNLEMERIY